MSDTSHRIPLRSVQIAGAFPAAFIVVGLTAQAAIVAAAEMMRDHLDRWVVSRFTFAEVFILIAFGLAYACSRHHDYLVRCYNEQESSVDDNPSPAKGSPDGEWPPAPRTSR